MSEENKNYNIDNENEPTNKDSFESVNEEPVYYSSLEQFYTDCDGDSKNVKGPKKITLSAFIISAVALMLAAAMLTWSLCMGAYREKLSSITNVNPGVPEFEQSQSEIPDLELLGAIFETYSYYGVAEEDIGEYLLKAYVAATGDRYAEYFTEEEYADYMDSVAGSSVGVGMNIIYTTQSFDGIEYKVLKVTNVSRESPAMRAGVRVGDLLFYVGVDEKTRESIHYLGYEEAMSKLLGEVGTIAEFTVLREKGDGAYEEVKFSIEREPITSESVYYHVCATDPSVGIVKIIKFDFTTPTQFSLAVDELMAKGIEKFVFDVRYNGGGSLDSIVAVLSYFLDEGQTIISTVNKNGQGNVITAQRVSGFIGDEAGCNVSRKDIGKYKGLKVAVLCNSTTASAAELFTANFRDYGIAKIVGEKTFGKGSMQTMIPLEYFGMSGVLKLTTNLYFPPSGESYDGIGITPDIEIALDEALKNKNIYDFTDAEDNQLQAAIKTLK